MPGFVRGRAGRAAAFGAIAILGVGALVAVAFTAWHSTDVQAIAAGDASSYTPPALVTPTPAPQPILAVVGDSDVTGAASGVGNESRWTTFVAKADNLDVRTYTVPGAGYVTAGNGGRTIGSAISQIPQAAVLVVLMGGSADAERAVSGASVTTATVRVVEAVKKRVPRATVLLVGPLTTDGAPDDALASLSSALGNAAGSASVPYVDPNAQVWLDTPRTSPTALTSGDQRAIAKHVEALAAQFVPSLAGTG